MTFGVKAAAYGCGISVRQLDWWTRVGYVPVLLNGRHRRYSANAVKIVLLIKVGISQGMSLRRSAEKARLIYPFLWEGAPPAPHLEDPPGTPNDELEAICGDVSRLTAEMADIGKRLSGLLGTKEAFESVDVAGEEDGEEDE